MTLKKWKIMWKNEQNFLKNEQNFVKKWKNFMKKLNFFVKKINYFGENEKNEQNFVKKWKNCVKKLNFFVKKIKYFGEKKWNFLWRIFPPENSHRHILICAWKLWGRYWLTELLTYTVGHIKFFTRKIKKIFLRGLLFSIFISFCVTKPCQY